MTKILKVESRNRIEVLRAKPLGLPCFNEVKSLTKLKIERESIPVLNNSLLTTANINKLLLGLISESK
jgi:hypothetical protein